MTIAARVAFLAAALICAGTVAARAQERPVKIGVLSDMSSLFSENSGPGSLVAARLAVEDFNPAAHGLKVEIVSADHQNKADIGANIARQWFDVDHVDAICWYPPPPPPTSPDRSVRRTRSTGATTPGCWRIAPAKRW